MLKQLKKQLKFLAVPMVLVAMLGFGIAETSVVACGPNDFSIACAVGGDTGSKADADTIRTGIQNITNIIAFIVAAVSVLFIVIGAARWMGGDEENGKKQIQNALIGLVIVIFAYLIATWVIGLLSGANAELTTIE